ncbi:MAG: V-type ATP synthase subunit I [Lachnospiraceae bacterium]|nr:V-type ATP synthase subunit I [Lachnospiraceae bacterium]
MAIVRMKHLRAYVVRPQRDALIARLLHLGCLDVHVPEAAAAQESADRFSPEKASLSELRSEQTRVQSALRIMEAIAPHKRGLLEPRPVVAESEFLNADARARDLKEAEEICALDAELKRLAAEEARLRTDMESLAPWKSMDLDLGALSTRTCGVNLMSALAQIKPESILAAAEEVTEGVVVLPVSEDTVQRSFLLIAHQEDLPVVTDAVRAIGCTQITFPGLTGTPADNLARLEKDLADLNARREEIRTDLASRGDVVPALRVTADRMSTEVLRAEVTERMAAAGEVSLLEGWFPAVSEEALAAVLADFDCAYETEDPEPEAFPDVPVKLKNSKAVTPINMVTDMYALPAYDGVDPNPLMWPFFVLFYGMMMADMGYGILMMLASLIVVKKAKPRGPTVRNLFPLLGICGITTFFFGAITGGFFGDLPVQLAKMIDPNTTFTKMPALFSPLDDALMVLIGSLALGVVQILTGMAVNAVKKIRRGQIADAVFEEGTWTVMLAGLAVFVLAKTPIVLIVGAVMLVVGAVRGAVANGGGPARIALGTFTGIFGSLYSNVTGYFSDILSYSRLMALMLAGAVIAQVFNTLGAITGNVVTFLIISMIGNALNFALNLLGCFVHDMRLQCLEFFGRFYEDGGKPFRPLEMQTQYVDVVKE